MTEENLDDTTVPIVTAEMLSGLLLEGIRIEIKSIELDKILAFMCRPLAIREERGIDDAVDKMIDGMGKPASDIEMARERMRLIIQAGVIEPEMTREMVENLPAGVYFQLADAINTLSGFQPKKSSTSSSTEQ